MFRLLKLKETPQEVRVGPAVVEARLEDVVVGRPKMYPHGASQMSERNARKLRKAAVRVDKPTVKGHCIISGRVVVMLMREVNDILKNTQCNIWT